MVTRTIGAVPASADAVVIGAGAFGFSTAYHLAAMGAGQVVLLDQYEPGTQVSPKAAGLFKMIQSTETNTRLCSLSRTIVTTFARETGVAMPYEASGSLFVGRKPGHARMIDAEVENARRWGVDIDLVNGADVRGLCPFIESDGVVAAYFVPDDFYIEEPRSMLMAYWQAGLTRGMQVFGHNPAIGLTVKDARIAGVSTTNGFIETETVVDCAGIWSRSVARMAGTDVLVQPVRHQLRISEPIDGIDAGMPIVRITDASAYVRPARGGLMYGGFEADPLPMPVVPEDRFTVDMVELDPDIPEQFRQSIEGSIPALRSISIQEDRGGVFTMTADGRLMVGPIETVHGFWVATGCNGSGFSLASAVGRCLAEWITDGEPSIDLSDLAPDRFEGQSIGADELESRSRWHYANYYTPQA